MYSGYCPNFGPNCRCQLRDWRRSCLPNWVWHCSLLWAALPDHVPKETCQQVSRQNCQQVPKKSCSQVPKETCRTGQIFTNTATLILEFQGFGIEFMITLVLVMVIFASASDANNKDLCERLCSSCHRPFHHHLPPLRHPPHRLHHEPSTQPGAQLGDGVLGQPLGVLGLSYPSWDKCWFSLPAGVPGELLGQVGGQRYHTIINTSTSLNFLFQAAPSHTDKGWTRRRWRTYCRTSWSSWKQSDWTCRKLFPTLM